MADKIVKTDEIFHDLLIENGNIVLYSDNASIAQKIRERLLLLRGEWFVNETIGIPYFQGILGAKTTPFPFRKFFIDAIKSVNGVTDVPSFSMNIDGTSRKLLISFECTTDQGRVVDTLFFGV